MAIAETEHSLVDDHASHDHGEFIAHHFDSAEQQFDSGKLGVWAFLVTEILFFSGLFVAYTLYRVHHPEIFEQAHIFLDKYLGALNTLVLLFSSLTMALGVRAAQLGKNRQVAFFVLITMFCAAMFLGVKAIEYSHKWDLGILVRSAFDYSPDHHHAAEPGTLAASLGVSPYLIGLSFVPAVFIGVVCWTVRLFQVDWQRSSCQVFCRLGCHGIGLFLRSRCWSLLYASDRWRNGLRCRPRGQSGCPVCNAG